MPIQGFAGFGGGTFGAAFRSAADDKRYIEDLIAMSAYRFVQQGDNKTLRNVTTGFDFSQSGERKFALSTNASTKFQVPSDWNNSNNSIECFGGGGCAGYHPSGSGGGGGGGYSKKSNITLTPGAFVDIHIAAGAGPLGGYSGQDGQDTWFGNSSYASATCAAKGGGGGQSGGTAGAGGAAADGIGDVKYSGGNGASGSDGGHGGGCAGPSGNGGNGTSSGPGAGDNGNGGAGGTNGSVVGSNGSNISTLFGGIGAGGGGYGKLSNNGGTGGYYGGGGGHTNGNVYNVGQGQMGMIIVTYTPANAGSGIDGMTWYKKRSGSGGHEISDTKRGIGKVVFTNSESAQQTSNNSITSYTNTGVLVQGDASQDAQNQMLWNFRLNEKFFDIQTWTGDGQASKTISHDLNSTPGFIMIKCTSDADTEWVIYHRQMPQNNTNINISNPQNTYITFDGYTFCADDSGKFNDTAPTTTNFTVGTDDEVNKDGSTYVAYIWAHNDSGTTGEEGIFGEDGDEEVINCGSFIGNGSSQSINLGWEPQWLLIRSATNVGGSSESEWFLFDSQRGVFTKSLNNVYDARISPSQSSSEYFNGNYVDFTATGFDVYSDARVNSNGNRMIYMAIRTPDGYVSKPPEAGTDALAIDAGDSNSIIPCFNSNFNVDFALMREPASVSSWLTGARLTGDQKLFINTNSAESDDSNLMWDNNRGYFIGMNSDRKAWMWRRGQGFDVVCYKGDGSSDRQISHNLNAVPEMMWLKARDSGSYKWNVYHAGANGGSSPEDWYILFTNGVPGTYTPIWNDTAPTATNFTVGNYGEVNSSSSEYLMMLFSSVSGISKIGYYTGDGTSNGSNAITVGFQPRFLIIKEWDTSSSTEWNLFDTTRGLGAGVNTLSLDMASSNSQDDEGSGKIELSSTAFIPGSGGSAGWNTDTKKYIYYAHA